MNLIDEVTSYENLLAAWDEIAKGRSNNHSFQIMNLYKNEILTTLQKSLKNGSYKPGGVFKFIIHEPKERHISAPRLIDRLVHHALIRVTLPYFERYSNPGSYANRKGRGNLAASIEYARLMRKALGKYGNYFVILSIDAKSFFASIDHEVLLRLLARLFKKDLSVLPLFALIIDSFSPGLPLGFLTSQHCANLIGAYIDYFVTDHCGYSLYIRYADDIKILLPDFPTAKELLYKIDEFAHTKLNITLSQKKTHIKPFKGYDLFCGYTVHPHSLSEKHTTVKRADKRTAKREREAKAGLIPWSKVAESKQSKEGYLSHCKKLTNKTQIRRTITKLIA